MIDGSRLAGLGAFVLVLGRALAYTDYAQSSPVVSASGLTMLLLGGADMAFEHQVSNAESPENLYLENTPSESVIDEMAGLGLEM
tara:strand:- start:71 stop:325 length:255 start_codon:yes stop_codon:yes gene_type:complete